MAQQPGVRLLPDDPKQPIPPTSHTHAQLHIPQPMSSLPAPTGGGEEVPAFLHELVPFRCPMGFVKPHTRAQLFDQKRGNRGNSNSSNSSSNITNNTYDHTGSVDWRAALRESSPLLQTFKNEANQLENDLLRAKEMELKHKTMSMQTLAKGSGFRIPENKRPAAENFERLHLNYEVKTKQKPASSDFQSSAQNKLVKEYLDKQNWLYSGPRPTTTTSDIHNQDTLLLRTPLTTEHYRRQHPSGRAPQEGTFNQPTTVEHSGAALARSDELLKQMEEFAEGRCRQQRQIIEELVQDMRTKEVDLNHLATERDRLQEDRSRLMANTERLVTQAGEYGTSVRQAHDDRGALLDSVSEELGKLRDLSEQELRARENEAKTAWGRCQTAEWERDQLSAETQRLLLRADADTERLRRTLQAKDDRLAHAKTELDRVRFEQESVLEKTLRVYRAAEESRQAARVAMETKEGQLQEAGHQMDAMAALHQRLVEQSRILTEQADENTSHLQRLLKVKVEQINDLMTQLDTLRAEKRRLEENSGSLAELAEGSQSEVAGLRTLVGEKEAELRTTQAQLEELKKFLQDTAAKERKARAELQSFIEELIDRTQRAEAELHTLKSLSASTTLNNVTTVEPSSLSHAVDSSERTGLPAAPSRNDIPLRNSRRTMTSNVAHPHTPAWRSGLPLFSDVSDTNVHNPKPPKVPSDASRRRKHTPKTSSRYNRDDISMKTEERLHTIDNSHRRSQTQRNIGSDDEEVQDWQESSGKGSLSGSEYIPIRERQSDTTDSSEIEHKESMPDSDNEYLAKQLNKQFLKTHRKRVLKTFQSGSNESKTRRPTSVGRSYNGKDMYSKEEPTKPNKDKNKIDSTKIKHTLDKSWDPTYPSGHKSMVDLSVKRSQRHEDRCRSRSLSPGALLDEHPGSEERSKKKLTGTKTSRNDAVTSDHVTEDSGLRGLMDENGILWDDMDTLPDVSDSELGRMSPSGSEAIATKATHVPSQVTKRMVSSHTAIHVPQARCTDIQSEMVKRNTRRLYNDNSNKLSSGSVKKSKSYSNFKFRPIKQASLEQKSLSDKDISSGGREVYKYITKPPEEENYDTHCISGYSPTLSRSDMSLSVRSNDDGKSYRNVESLQDKIQRISERFSNQRKSRN
ncbi:FBX41-like protein, partial [Mya arenaria]